jgi:hypothetical protein
VSVADLERAEDTDTHLSTVDPCYRPVKGGDTEEIPTGRRADTAVDHNRGQPEATSASYLERRSR